MKTPNHFVIIWTTLITVAIILFALLKRNIYQWKPKYTLENFLKNGSFEHYYNVCINVDRNTNFKSFSNKFRAQILAYDQTQSISNNKQVRYMVNLQRDDIGDSYWQLNVTHETVPVSLKMLDSIAYFVPYWRENNNIYLLWNFILPSVHAQLKWSKTFSAEMQNYKNLSTHRILITPRTKTMKSPFRDATQLLGIDTITDLDTMLKDNTTCFKHGVFGSTASRRMRSISREFIHEKLNATAEPCVSLYLLIIQRHKTRRILNIDYLAQLARDFGHKNVRIEYFEKYSLYEQFDIIRCSVVLVGVQGAALSWFPFLPLYASIIKINWPGWPMFYQKYIQIQRKDLYAQVIQCDAKTPENVWKHYAHVWFNYTGVGVGVGDAMKEKLIERSKQIKHATGYSIWKDSDCLCTPSVFSLALRNILKFHYKLSTKNSLSMFIIENRMQPKFQVRRRIRLTKAKRVLVLLDIRINILFYQIMKASRCKIISI